MNYIMVQAGGRGSRLGHITANKPKALAPVDNLPMIFHLFNKYPDKRFIIIADYKREVLHEYLSAFAKVKYQIVDACGKGTCAGLGSAVRLIPEGEPFMLIWSDLVLPVEFKLPDEYCRDDMKPQSDYVALSQSFKCRWRYMNHIFEEVSSEEFGVAGMFLFTGRDKLESVPREGEFVRWLMNGGRDYKIVGIGGTKEFGVLEEYNKLKQAKCRPFNRTRIEYDDTVGSQVFIKEAIDEQGSKLALRECAWYDKAKHFNIAALPEIYGINPLRMEYIDGKNIYELELAAEEKRHVLEVLVDSLKKLHVSSCVPADSFSIHEAYYNKTIKRISEIQDLVPFAHDREILINGKKCRNVFYYKRLLERNLNKLITDCDSFSFIHGDCTFSNIMLRSNGLPVLIDPRGYFGYTELYGDARYDWAKLYYSVVGNYDRFNLKQFELAIGENAAEGVTLKIDSNNFEDMEDYFFELTGCDRWEIRLLHAVIWLSLTTYAWQDYDSICGAFYNGLWYLEDVLREDI